jgi:catechol 2,3-dioxygenase-like lactoylglutathione lyase family enzyme
MSHNTFHVALSVTDLPTAIEQYRKILGMEPAKVKPDYAKFEIADPPVILSLNLGGEPGTVSHLGIRYAETELVTQALARTKAEGIAVREQPGTTCCYAKADKFWVHDTDGMGWEMYTLLEDAEVHSIVETPKDQCCSPTVAGESNAEAQAASRCCAPAVNAPAEGSLVQIQAKSTCC